MAVFINIVILNFFCDVKPMFKPPPLQCIHNEGLFATAGTWLQINVGLN